MKDDFNDGQLLPAGLNLKSGDRILDAGTGTGAWAIDVAQSVAADVEVIGVDIESRLYPSQHPQNLVLAVHSVLSLPEEWTTTFALGHSRLFVGAFSLDDWKKALSEFHRVLKPGGWVILEEIDAIHTFPEDMRPDPPMTAKLVQARAALGKAKNNAVDCFPKITAMLVASGFEDVQMKSRALLCGPGDIGKRRRYTFAGLWRALRKPMVAGRGYGAGTTEEEYDKTVNAALEEWNSFGISHKVLSWTARKSERPRQGDEV